MANTLNTNRSDARCLREDQGTIPITSRYLDMRMNGRMSLARRAKWFLPVLAAMFLLAAMPKIGFGQGLTIVSPPDAYPPCTDTNDCCTEFRLQMPAAGTYTLDFSITGLVDPSPSTCFDSDCFTAQTAGGATYSHPNPGINEYEVTWTSTGPTDYVEFWLCGNGYCMSDYGLYNLSWNIEGSNDNGQLTLNSCGGTPGNPCLNCDYTWYYPDGYICLTRGMANPCWATLICFTFSNPLPPCVETNLNYVDPDWTPSFTTDVHGYVTEICFTLNTLTGGTALPPCGTFCFQVGDCCSLNWRPSPPAPLNVCVSHLTEMIQGLSTDPGGTCNPPNTSCTLNTGQLKEADGPGITVTYSGDSSQNYPNPIDAASGFNTTVQFGTSVGGTATITIVNDKGVKVLTDDEEILGAGQHFFYFSAKDLPSGTYYYTIEFPQGVIIASKTMMVVK